MLALSSSRHLPESGCGRYGHFFLVPPPCFLPAPAQIPPVPEGRRFLLDGGEAVSARPGGGWDLSQVLPEPALSSARFSVFPIAQPLAKLALGTASACDGVTVPEHSPISQVQVSSQKIRQTV